ncbi:MAG: Gfo/Idh/MocA family oxidoreductase, partial [Verrucomicrobia bacterium]|nr:Gfo/Idh/MocA family oxidoreductase [Verrucomicrobiota bacterium]
MKTTRRNFIKTASLASASLFPMPLLGAAPGKRYRTALIGCGWWGTNILREAMASGQCKVVGLCDVYQRPLQVTADEVEGESGDQPEIFDDYRELLAKVRPEIVIIATPDH